ncbi:hypothetical protein PoB_000398400 [Plakobranchus ocellatus]|uniref:Uncharacterized protein n=1 Tax=Plakobranchus ocellatus TaxID=259542 RepID=A0AAV3Y5G5_9GAST|nr:hypothetical protein PoB_000398400 [Plakobranchus ocellatus]
MHVAECYEKIPPGSYVVFDWDNTLKLVNKTTKSIECSVTPIFLSNLISEKGCQLYIISAIRPSKMNMETLLMEVDKLGVREFFCPQGQQTFPESHKDTSCTSNGQQTEHSSLQSCSIQHVKKNSLSYVRCGNIVICGYDKAEVFLQLIEAETSKRTTSLGQIKNEKFSNNISKPKAAPRFIFEAEVEDDVNGLEKNFDSLDTRSRETEAEVTSDSDRPVVFFDDEEVNILNFGSIVKNSKCFWVH